MQTIYRMKQLYNEDKIPADIVLEKPNTLSKIGSVLKGKEYTLMNIFTKIRKAM